MAAPLKPVLLFVFAAIAGCVGGDAPTTGGQDMNDPANIGRGKAYYVRGDLRKRHGAGEWGRIQRGADFLVGDAISTGTSARSLLIFSNGTRILVQLDTEFVLERLEQAPFDQARLGTFMRLKADPSKSVIVLRLIRGTIEGQAWPLHSGSRFTVSTDVGEVSVRGGFFRVSAQAAGEGGAGVAVTASCGTGSMAFTPPQGRTVSIPAGAELEARAMSRIPASVTTNETTELAVGVSPLRCYYPRSKDLILRVVEAFNEANSDYNSANPGNPIPLMVPPEAPSCPLKDSLSANGPMPYPR